jgi:hypothetical protein
VGYIEPQQHGNGMPAQSVAGQPPLNASWLDLARVLRRIAERHEREILQGDEQGATVAKGSAA